MPLDALPYDVKELILSALDSPKDLLRLALTSKSWKSLVIPHHIEYRLLRLDDHRPEVWKHLAEKRLLASRIRTVVLGPDYRLLPGVGQSQSSLYPRTLLSTPTSEAAQIKDVQVVREDVLQALRNMTSLVSFSLHLEYDPECPLQPLPGDPFAGKEIVQALKESKSLRKVSISDLGNKIFSCGLKHHEAEVGLEDVLWAFRDLEELSTTIPFPKLTAAVKAVQPMSNLRRLCIRPGTYHLSSDFLSYTFPHLHTFDLNVFPFGEPEVWDQPVIEFLSRHPTIEVLEWQTLYQTRPPRLSRTLLPNLKVIRSNHKFVLGIVASGGERPLTEIHDLGLDEQAFAILFRERRALTSVRCITVAHAFNYGLFLRLGSIFPSLEVMYLRPDQPGAFSLDDFAMTASHFPSLRCLPTVSVLFKASQKEKLVRNLLAACSTLTWVTAICERSGDQEARSYLVQLQPERWEEIDNPAAGCKFPNVSPRPEGFGLLVDYRAPLVQIGDQ